MTPPHAAHERNGHGHGTGIRRVAGRAADAVRHPEEIVKRARRLAGTAPIVRDAVAPLLTRHVVDWHTEFAYSTGLQAFVYGFPYLSYARIRYHWVTQQHEPPGTPYAPVNHFWHRATLTNATYRGGGLPNNDTLYSTAWVDLSEEPVVLSHPAMGERYFAFQLTAFTSDNFAYVGQRATGAEAGSYALLGPGWEGDLPEGVTALERSPTPWILVLGRTLVRGQEDLAAVHALQAQYRLTPLGLWGRERAVVPARRDVYAPGDPEVDPMAPWRTINAMFAQNPPPARHAPLLDQFARVGVGPGLDVDMQPVTVRRGLLRAAYVGLPLLRAQFISGDWATVVNGWRYPPATLGRAGDDFLMRAADQCLAGIAANDPAEAVYLVTFEDADGARLSPRGRYELRFEASELPPVDAFWSLTAYTAADMNLIPNAAARYSVGDRTAAPDRDGGLTIALQPQSPGGDRERNWLPTSAEHDWFVILRLYRPRAAVVEGTWRAPGLVRRV